jgi:hypothetical protein
MHTLVQFGYAFQHPFSMLEVLLLHFLLSFFIEVNACQT